jgi:polar amino acid transport system permease protein
LDSETVERLWIYGAFLLRGVRWTLQLSFMATLGGAVVGLIVALARISRWRPLRWAGTLYVDLFRSIPPLVQLMWLYYALPILTGRSGLSAVNSVAIGLSLYAGSILAEIFRAGILSIGRGQWDAGRAIGMRPTQVFRRIVLPQAVVRMLPAFGNAFIFSIKTSSLAYAFGVHELLRQVEALSGFTLRRAEVFTAGALIYFLIIYPMTIGVNRLHHRYAMR